MFPNQIIWIVSATIFIYKELYTSNVKEATTKSGTKIASDVKSQNKLQDGLYFNGNVSKDHDLCAWRSDLEF